MIMEDRAAGTFAVGDSECRWFDLVNREWVCRAYMRTLYNRKLTWKLSYQEEYLENESNVWLSGNKQDTGEIWTVIQATAHEKRS